MIQCTLCPRTVTKSELTDAYTEQTVLVHGPKKNGAKLAQDTGRYAHKECVDQALADVLPGTLPLFDLP